MRRAPIKPKKGGADSRESDYPYLLPDAFWTKFLSLHWNKSPTVIRKPFKTPLMSEAEVMRWLIKARDRLKESERQSEYMFYVDDGQIVTRLEPWLPDEGDDTLEKYARRLSAPLKGRSFGLLCEGIQLEGGWEFWNRLRQFLTGLYGRVGAPSRGVETLIFLGDYRMTPFGVHRDDGDVFSFVLSGKKRFRLWPRSSFAGQPAKMGLGNYERHLAESICLECGPGDVAYWPASYWHVAESGGAPSLSMSLALDWGAPKLEIAETIEQHLNSSFKWSSDRCLPFGAALPEDARKMIERCEEGFSGLNWRDRLTTRWMSWMSAHAFNHIPRELAAEPVGVGDGIRVDPLFPIFFQKTGERCLVAANGLCRDLPNRGKVEKLVESLNSGASWNVRDLLGKCAIDGREAPAILALLTDLRKRAAVQVRPGEGPRLSTPAR